MGRRPEKIFLKRGDTNGQQVHRRCSMSLITREMQIKIMKRHSLTLPAMFIMKKKKKITNASEDENKREPLYTVSENVNWYSHTEKKRYTASPKTNKRTTKTSSSTPGFTYTKIKNRNLKRYMHPNDHSNFRL